MLGIINANVCTTFYTSLVTSLLKFVNFRGYTCAPPTADVDDSPEDFIADWVNDSGKTIAADTHANKKTFKIVYNANQIQLYINYNHSCANSLNVKTVFQYQAFFLTE